MRFVTILCVCFLAQPIASTSNTKIEAENRSNGNQIRKFHQKRGAFGLSYPSLSTSLHIPTHLRSHWKKEPTLVEKYVAVPVHIKVPVDRPVPVPKLYPVTVEKPVPVPVKINVPQPFPVYKKVPVAVRVPVDRPVPVHVLKPYPVYVEKQVPYPVDKPVPVPVEVPVDRPVPIYVAVEKPTTTTTTTTTEKPAMMTFMSMPMPMKMIPQKSMSLTSGKSLTWLDSDTLDLSSLLKANSENLENEKLPSSILKISEPSAEAEVSWPENGEIEIEK